MTGAQIAEGQVAFYPTYEEWKQSSLGMIRHAEYFLFILPMRNGNFFLKFHLTIH